jgi:transporter family protein
MKWLMFALLSAITTACSVILASMGLNHMNPISAATVNTAMTSGFLLITHLAFNSFSTSNLFIFDKTQGMYVLLAGITNGIAWIFYSTALKHGLASKVTAVDQLSLIFTLLLCAFFLGEGYSIYCVIGSIFMSIGVYLISL